MNDYNRRLDELAVAALPGVIAANPGHSPESCAQLAYRHGLAMMTEQRRRNAMGRNG